MFPAKNSGHERYLARIIITEWQLKEFITAFKDNVLIQTIQFDY